MRELVVFIISTSFLLCSVFSQSTVKTLPGYSGNLPFYLETGYISVGESDEIELFYYFIESERNPEKDPLLLWLTGGPGCSAFSGLVIEIGPLSFDYSSFNGSLTQFIPRQHSWTKIANVIFVDSPVGTGFSYATQTNSYNTSDTLSAKDTVSFLRKWLLKHPAFIRNDLYIAGDSYAGKIVPIVVLDILNGNEAGLEPQMSLQGYLIGNPVTNSEIENNEKIPYAHGMGLISTEYYELAKRSCRGQYVNPDPDNVQCLRALEHIYLCLRDIPQLHILAKLCPSTENNRRGVTLLEDDLFDVKLLSSKREKTTCITEMDNIITSIWANNPQVQDALHVRKGTIKKWKRCNFLREGDHYEVDVESVIPYHRVLSQKILKALVYSGDHDIEVPHIATLKWIQHLNLILDDHWRPWNVNGQVAGYTQRYKMKDFTMTFSTVKGGGHVAVQFNPEECFAMFDRWISSIPL